MAKYRKKKVPEQDLTGIVSVGDKVRWWVEENKTIDGTVEAVYKHCFLMITDGGRRYAPPLTTLLQTDIMAAKYGPARIIAKKEEAK